MIGTDEPEISYGAWSAADIGRLDFRRLGKPDEDFYLRPLLERAESQAKKWSGISVEERFKGFRLLGFKPHGFYLPDQKQYADVVWSELRRLGKIDEVDERLKRYFKFQELTEQLQKKGIEGNWTGQQGVARSQAQFRLVGCGRRWGKTFYAAYEALAVCVVRPRARVWIAAPIMKLVSRSFSEYVIPLVEELGIKTKTIRDSTQDKYIVFENGSVIEGISLDNVMSVAGATIDFAIVDEAAQMLPDAWYRGILPPLASHNGQALLISSFEGQGDFFSDQSEKMKAEEAEYRSRITDIIEEAPKVEWETFQSPSYEANFFDFPQGRETPSIKLQERNMPPEEFAEQFGAIPGGTRERVYKEFVEKVHVGAYYYDPDEPVYLSIDPSTGINEYAVGAFQHWKVEGIEIVVMIDEFYRTGMTAEIVAPMLDRRPWRSNVTEAVVDAFAGQDEVIRWLSLGFPAIATPDPGEVEDGLPLVRNMLRHPERYYWWYRSKVNQVLEQMNLEPDADLGMLTRDTHEIYARVAENIAPDKLAREDIEWLRASSRLFLGDHCVNAVTEFKLYSYEKKRRQNLNYKEKPRKYKDHIMDLTRNHIWAHYRFELDNFPRLPRSYMGPSASSNYSPEDFGQPAPRPLTRVRSPGQGVLGQWRSDFSGGVVPRGHSYMGAARSEAQRLLETPVA
jgi:terminase large subunit-like protein